ncbi:DarT ssDNA thymidine ADP-ribosyltransferase family protein [uncultured Sphingomonas sp.]|uniref:DarT ssDNA thymidine ADP-ribosyltransferase family protein n=1 Tax=uncultured Sphingomonas sp. TaxID=158754 RepID=UPI003424AECA
MTIAELTASKGIQEVLHFTTNRGIVGTLASHSLQSRHRLPRDKYLEHILHVNAASRPEARAFFDKSQNWLDYVNLSISEINRRYFLVSQRWHEDKDVWWGILAFDPVIMTHEGVVFATTNNGYDRCSRAAGEAGLEALFQPTIRRKSNGWSVTRNQRVARLPTCEQAEILYPGEVSTDYLRRVYVSEEDHHDQARGWLDEFGLPNVDVLISPGKFDGMPN